LKRHTSTTSYTQVIRIKLQLRDETIEVASKPGLPDWSQISPVTLLIAEKIVLPKDARLLYLGCGNGAGAITRLRTRPII